MQIRNPMDSVEILKSLRNKRQEHFGVICLDSVLNVISKKTLFIGGTNSCKIDSKIIFWEACCKKASGIILFHNHPGNIAEPSVDDIRTTKVIETACKAIGIQFLDHVIIGRTCYFSFREADMVGVEDKEKAVAEN